VIRLVILARGAFYEGMFEKLQGMEMLVRKYFMDTSCNLRDILRGLDILGPIETFKVG
jgi:hypothetical protein